MELSKEEDKRLTQLAKKMGQKQASILLSVLGKQKQFLNALDTPVGQELLKDVVSAIEGKIELILKEKDTEEDRAELRAYRGILNRWQKTIANYDKNKEIYNKNVI